MRHNIYTPLEFRKNIYTIMEDINNTQSEVEIIDKQANRSVVVLDANYWDEIKETLYLLNTGVLDLVNERLDDDSSIS